MQKFQATHARQFQVGQDQIYGLVTENLERRFGILGRERAEAVFSEIQFEQAAHLGFVFDDEDGGRGQVAATSFSTVALAAGKYRTKRVPFPAAGSTRIDP